ncbi:MAG: DM13 domain-containing protein [Solirubrobacterales bacterium]|nr:DM13 domain-containing protein [Solirubrobacterales bacterium]
MSRAPKLLAPVGVVVALVAGLWFWSGQVAPGYFSAIAFGVLWFVVCSIAFGRIGKRRPELRWWLRGPFLACSLVACVAFYWTSIRETEFNETIVTGVAASELPAADQPAVDPLAPQPAVAASTEPGPAPAPTPKTNVVERRGEVRPASHSASGTARIVTLAAGGRRLTLSDGFEIDPGPEVRVYLATDASGATFKDLGKLKGDKGTQQYAVASDVDLDRYDTLVLWCVPFTVSLATAELKPA